eukprot:gene10072-8924_t
MGRHNKSHLFIPEQVPCPSPPRSEQLPCPSPPRSHAFTPGQVPTWAIKD